MNLPTAPTRRSRRSRVVAVAVVITAVPALAGGDRGPPSGVIAELERTASEELASRSIPGAAVAVVKDDRVVFMKGFGVASIETGAPVTPDTLFQIGSITKTFTAALVVSVAEEGRIRLELPVGEYVKGLAPGLSRVTTAQLLSHTGGLKDEPDESALADYARSWTDEYCLFTPGQVFSYSNSGFALAGLVAQEAAGSPSPTRCRSGSSACSAWSARPSGRPWP